MSHSLKRKKKQSWEKDKEWYIIRWRDFSCSKSSREGWSSFLPIASSLAVKWGRPGRPGQGDACGMVQASWGGFLKVCLPPHPLRAVGVLYSISEHDGSPNEHLESLPIPLQNPALSSSIKLPFSWRKRIKNYGNINTFLSCLKILACTKRILSLRGETKKRE